MTNLLHIDELPEISSGPQVLRFAENGPLVCCDTCRSRPTDLTTPYGPIGNVTHEFILSWSKFSVRDVDGDVILWIDSPWCIWEDCADTTFRISEAGGQRVGSIKRRSKGCRIWQETGDVYELTFPIGLDVRWKAALVVATIGVDRRYFENYGHAHRRRF